MKHPFLTLALAVAIAAMASATVTYSTNGTFDCTNGSIGGSNTISGCGTGQVTLDDNAGINDEQILLSFVNVTSQMVNATLGTAASYGLIDATCTGNGCTTGATPITVPGGDLQLTILISETTPDNSLNNNAGSANVSGPIAFDSSSLAIGAYSGSPLTITGSDMVIYTLDTNDTLFAPSNGAVPGQTTLGMTITDEAQIQGGVPEPATLALMGVGLAILGLIARRRKG